MLSKVAELQPSDFTASDTHKFKVFKGFRFTATLAFDVFLITPHLPHPCHAVHFFFILHTF